MVDSEPPSLTTPSLASDSPYSSPDTSPTIRRPFTTVGWEHPYTCVGPPSRPSTTIGWESRVLEKATLEQGGKRYSSAGRRHSTGTRRSTVATSPELEWYAAVGQTGRKPGMEDSEKDWSVSVESGAL